MHRFDISLEHITKIEGAASLKVKVKDKKVERVEFETTEYKRFFTVAMQGKSIAALPQAMARICGTCSNAHIICSIEACENALGIKPTHETMLLRTLVMHGLMIRDHALHLYLFALPDLYQKDSFLDLDENNQEEHQLLHDGFEVKSAGNFLATLIAGRSVHGTYPTIGGFLRFPEAKGINEAAKKLEASRSAVLRLVEIFKNSPFQFDRKTNYMALVPKKTYGYLDGSVLTSKGEKYGEEKFRECLEHVVLPYSQASAYEYQGQGYMVGALARMNLAKNLLNPNTKASIKAAIEVFPSTNIFDNNLAQAIEVLHSIDESMDILKNHSFSPEPLIKGTNREGVGIGVIEAPRGTLYHKVVLGKDGIVKEGEVIVPTGQNQINIELDIGKLVEGLLSEDVSKKRIEQEIEKLIRAYDPCMSCAAHFLKVEWQ